MQEFRTKVLGGTGSVFLPSADFLIDAFESDQGLPSDNPNAGNQRRIFPSAARSNIQLMSSTVSDHPTSKTSETLLPLCNSSVVAPSAQALPQESTDSTSSPTRTTTTNTNPSSVVPLSVFENSRNSSVMSSRMSRPASADVFSVGSRSSITHARSYHKLVDEGRIDRRKPNVGSKFQVQIPDFNPKHKNRSVLATNRSRELQKGGVCVWTPNGMTDHTVRSYLDALENVVESSCGIDRLRPATQQEPRVDRMWWQESALFLLLKCNFDVSVAYEKFVDAFMSGAPLPQWNAMAVSNGIVAPTSTFSFSSSSSYDPILSSSVVDDDDELTKEDESLLCELMELGDDAKTSTSPVPSSLQQQGDVRSTRNKIRQRHIVKLLSKRKRLRGRSIQADGLVLPPNYVSVPGEDSIALSALDRSVWSFREVALFTVGFKMYGKSFRLISDLVGTKSTEECIKYFYVTKNRCFVPPIHYRKRLKKIALSDESLFLSDEADNAHFESIMKTSIEQHEQIFDFQPTREH